MKKIQSALISVFHKEGLKEIIKKLSNQSVRIYSTGGTQKYIEELGEEVHAVEDLTSYPSILGGRVKTLHPKVFGGILSRRENDNDVAQLTEYDIPEIDLVIVDLYPFEKTVETTTDENQIIEKIDIGGISLIRAAAKNYRDVLVVSSQNEYGDLLQLLMEKQGHSSIEDRKLFAAKSFAVSSNYDSTIFNYFNQEDSVLAFRKAEQPGQILRYGENPHQEAIFYGKLNEKFDKLNGKALSYNNLVDIDAAVNVIAEFTAPTFAILKHTNTCGLATRDSVLEAYIAALACDNVSAFGGILITNEEIDINTAEEIHKLFCEVVVAPSFSEEAIQILSQKKNRIILKQKDFGIQSKQFKSLLNGVLTQDYDAKIEGKDDLKIVTEKQPTQAELSDLEFGIKAVKHLKSNGIALIKNNQLVGMGCGQTSRVDALKQAIKKAHAFHFNLEGAIMASDAFFPFPDCVEIAQQAGITAVVQPGGSIRDQDSIDFCNNNNVGMAFSGVRHFKH